jgi:hypothetical protein
MGENSHTIKGTIYAIETELIKGKKDPTQSYPKYTITLEVKTAGEVSKGGKDFYTTATQLPQFEWFNPKTDMEQYAIGDYVELRFYLAGKEFIRKTGDKVGQKGIMNKNIITFMRFADLTLDDDHPTHKGKIKVDNPKVDPVFQVPDPGVELGMEDDLPF